MFSLGDNTLEKDVFNGYKVLHQKQNYCKDIEGCTPEKMKSFFAKA